MKYKYSGQTRVYRHETLGGMKLREGDVIEDCSIVTNNRDSFVEVIEEEKKQVIVEKPITDDIKKPRKKKIEIIEEEIQNGDNTTSERI